MTDDRELPGEEPLLSDPSRPSDLSGRSGLSGRSDLSGLSVLSDHELSQELTELVASTAGVIEVYPSATTLQTLPALPLALLPDGLLPEGLLPDRLLPSNLVPTGVAPDEKVAVSRTPTGSLTVTATIGVGGGHTVLETVRRVSDALRAHLEAIEPSSASLAPELSAPVSSQTEPSRGAPSEPPVIHVRVSRVDSAQVP